MAADNLVRQGAKASSVMLLTKFSQSPYFVSEAIFNCNYQSVILSHFVVGNEMKTGGTLQYTHDYKWFW